MGNDQPSDQYSDEEAQRRFEALIRAALTTPPKPKKDIPRQRPYRPRQRKAAAPSSKSRDRA